MAKKIEDVLKEFHQTGTTVTEWAKRNHFNPWLVYTILQGRRKCLRGKSHKIAVALGIKDSYY